MTYWSSIYPNFSTSYRESCVLSFTILEFNSSSHLLRLNRSLDLKNGAPKLFTKGHRLSRPLTI